MRKVLLLLLVLPRLVLPVVKPQATGDKRQATHTILEGGHLHPHIFYKQQAASR
jgi:hypothetical protein